MRERAAAIILAVCMAAAMTGCSVFNRTHGYNDREYSVTVERDIVREQSSGPVGISEKGGVVREGCGPDSYDVQGGEHRLPFIS